MRVKFLIDEDVHFSLAEALRRNGYDALHVQEINRKGLGDYEQLDLAISQKRCIVSFNVRDFAILHEERIQDRQSHWGIIVSKQRPVGETLRLLLKKITDLSQETVKNQILFL